MADQFLSLLDITARRGTDAAVGLVEEVVTFAPEIERIMGRPIPGAYYTARVRTAYTANAAFRKANQGVAIGSSKFTQKRFDCFAFDAQLQVDEIEVKMAEQQGDSAAQLQADEAIGAVRAKAILLGQQVYNGTLTDPSGFPGLIDFLATQLVETDPLTKVAVDQSVDAGGSAAGKCERVWFIWMHNQGVHFLFGGNQGLDISPWTKQRVGDSSTPVKHLTAWVANVNGLIGLSCAHVRALGCIRNVDNTLAGGNYTKPVTDALIAQLEAKFPIGIAPNLCFMSRKSRAGLQQSRTVTLLANMMGATASQSGAAGSIAPLPTATASGIPIIATDSIPLGNQAAY